MTTFTKPLLALPIKVSAPTSHHIRITFADSSIGATTVDATVTTGTYWNHRQSGTSSLGDAIVAALNAAETAKGGGFTAGTWAVSTRSGDDKHKAGFKRSGGHADDDLAGLTFSEPTKLSGLQVGFASNTATPTDVDASNTHTWDSTYQRGHIWAPREQAEVVVEVPDRAVKVGRSLFDRSSVVHLYSMDDIDKGHPIQIDNVHGALISHSLAARTDFIANVPGGVAGDTNLTLESFWRLSATLAPIRYLPDEDAPGAYTEIQILDEDWLRSYADAVPFQGEMDLYSVTIPAETYS